MIHTLYKYIRFTAISLVLLITAAPALAGIAVIGNAASHIQSLTLVQIQALYKNKPAYLPRGIKLTPVDQPSNSQAYREFYRTVFNWNPSQVNNYWSSLIFSGEGNPPESVGSAHEAIQTVKNYRDVIAYIDTQYATNLPQGVRVLYSSTPIHVTKKKRATTTKTKIAKKKTPASKPIPTKQQTQQAAAKQLAAQQTQQAEAKQLTLEQQQEAQAEKALTAKKLTEQQHAQALAKKFALEQQQEAQAEKALAAKKLAQQAAAKKFALEQQQEAQAEKTLAAEKLAQQAAAKKLTEQQHAQALAKKLALEQQQEAQAEKTLAAEKLAQQAAAKKLTEQQHAQALAKKLALEQQQEAQAEKTLAAKKLAQQAAAKKLTEQQHAQALAKKLALEQQQEAQAEKTLAAKKLALKQLAQKTSVSSLLDNKQTPSATALIKKTLPTAVPQLMLTPARTSKSDNTKNQVSPNLILDPIATSTPTQTTIWTTMAKGFSLAPETNQPSVKAAIQSYLKHPRSLEKIFNNAQPYIYYIYQQTKLRGIPAELALIPVIESGYNPLAYSGVGATGLWQMMPATASELGLPITWWYDGRGDLLASTNKALNYFQSLHNYFDNWPLSIAAYDFGVGALKSAIKYNKAQRLPTDFWSLNLPQETKSYVPKLLALATIISTPGHYGIKLPAIPNKPYFAQVTMNSQINLNTAAQLADVKPAIIREINPGFRRLATDPNAGTYTLLIPEAHLKIFQKNLSAIANVPQISWLYHQVRRNETLASIARNYHTSIRNLRRANSLSNYTKVEVGQGILVPVKLKRTIKASSYQTGAASLVSSSQYGDETDQVIYSVLSGDTLESIANQYGVSPQDILKWNHLTAENATLVPGQQLRILLSGSSINVTPTADRVQQGDSLKDIVDKLYNSPSP